MKKTWQKLLSLNLVILLLLSMSVSVFAAQALQIGDNTVEYGGEYTYTPEESGVYLLTKSGNISLELSESNRPVSYFGMPHNGSSEYYRLTAGVTYIVSVRMNIQSAGLRIEMASPVDYLVTGYHCLVEYGAKAVTFTPFSAGYYGFEGDIAVALYNESGKAVGSVGKGVYHLEGGKTYTVIGAENGKDIVKVQQKPCQTIRSNNSGWQIITAQTDNKDLIVLNEKGAQEHVAFTNSVGQTTQAVFYAQAGKTYYCINSEYRGSMFGYAEIISTSIDCVTLKEGVTEDFYNRDDGQMAIYKPQRSGEHVFSCAPTACAVVLDQKLTVLAGSAQTAATSGSFTAMLQAGETYYFITPYTLNRLSVKNKWGDSLKVFKDIQKGDWFVKNSAIDYAYNMGFFKGITPTTFEPNTSVTRGMFVTVLGRLHGEKEVHAKTQFTDVKKGAYYSGYVAWAAKNGIVTGTSKTTFAPEAPVTREQICAMMFRYCDFADIPLKKINKPLSFKDADNISAYAKTAVSACQTGGIVGGKGGGIFDPQGNATRAEVATILMNFYRNYR